MKSFTSRVTLESALSGFQGVRFVLNRMTEGRRIKLRLSLAVATDRLRSLMLEREQIEADGGKDGARAVDLLGRVSAVIEDEVNPAWLRWGLHSLDALEIDGEAATPDSLIESGPPELYSEILVAIRREAGLSEDEQKNSESPTTSGAVAGQGTSGISAPVASVPVST